MPAPRLKFKAIDGLMVWDHNAALAGARRYVGRRFDPSAPGDHLIDKHPADDSLDYPDVPEMAHALRAVRDGELLAADEYTASRAKVPFKATKPAPSAKDSK